MEQIRSGVTTWVSMEERARDPLGSGEGGRGETPGRRWGWVWQEHLQWPDPEDQQDVPG